MRRMFASESGLGCFRITKNKRTNPAINEMNLASHCGGTHLEKVGSRNSISYRIRRLATVRNTDGLSLAARQSSLRDSPSPSLCSLWLADSRRAEYGRKWRSLRQAQADRNCA